MPLLIISFASLSSFFVVALSIYFSPQLSQISAGTFLKTMVDASRSRKLSGQVMLMLSYLCPFYDSLGLKGSGLKGSGERDRLTAPLKKYYTKVWIRGLSLDIDKRKFGFCPTKRASILPPQPLLER